jgi:hypothetical protein
MFSICNKMNEMKNYFIDCEDITNQGISDAYLAKD